MDEADQKKFVRTIEQQIADAFDLIARVELKEHKKNEGFDGDIKYLSASAKTANKEITDLKARVKDLESKIAKMKK